MRLRLAPVRLFEWSREALVLVAADSRRFPHRSKRWSRDAHRSAAVSLLAHQGGRNWWILIARGPRVDCVLRSWRGPRREEAAASAANPLLRFGARIGGFALSHEGARVF